MQLKPRKIYTEYGEGAVADRTCQKWFAKFRARDFSLDGAPWSGRPVEVESDHIETFIYREHTTLYHTGDSQHTQNTKSRKLLVKMKNVCFTLWKKLNRLFGQANTL